ncbi:MAG TPA: hypothetical protein VLA24_10235 [Pseudomonadales bacterium]|nr:hypothetical protein [Pseudomonadales bacterium]
MRLRVSRFLNVAKKLSATALSWQLPRLLMEGVKLQKAAKVTGVVTETFGRENKKPLRMELSSKNLLNIGVQERAKRGFESHSDEPLSARISDAGRCSPLDDESAFARVIGVFITNWDVFE